jgi:threonine/homoserine/homoserine lactone efflux protein
LAAAAVALRRPPASRADLLALGLLFNAMTLSWLTVYALMVSRLGDVLRGHPIRRSLEAITGLVLVDLGLRLAAERR